MRNFLVFFVFAALVSCQSPEPRTPLVKTSGHFLKESVMRNKAVQEKEENQIKEIIQKDTANIYIMSSYGFWYSYQKQNEDEHKTPDFGDLVKFKYSISTIDGTLIYAENEIGIREYYMDKEDIFTGLRLALKLMKAGETATFYLPSYMAFGYYGDNDKIGGNVPVKVKIQVQSITEYNLKNQNQLTL